MARIHFFELETWEEHYFKKHLKGHVLIFDKKPLTTKNATRHADAEIVVCFVGSELSKQTLDKLPSLSFVATMSTGYDHIDLVEAKKRSISVSNVPTYGQHTVAEHAFGLLLALNRHLIEAITRTKQCNFDFSGLLGHDVKGKTLGIIGTGKIGASMIRYAKAFDMTVIATDASPSKELANELGFRYVRLPTLLKQADFISLHLPLLPTTRHIIDKKAFSLMKKGVKIINTGRGPLIDTKALLVALRKGIVGGCALDVLEEENDLKKEAKLVGSRVLDSERLCVLAENNLLMKHPNVLITPHLAFYTKEAIERILSTTLKNINGHLRKRHYNNVTKLVKL